jgi:hypothetical protein
VPGWDGRRLFRNGKRSVTGSAVLVLDLTAQLDRESAERHKVETILRELLEAHRNRLH